VFDLMLSASQRQQIEFHVLLMYNTAMGSKLTPKQERFCQAYVETGNGAEAYRQAYDTKAKAQVCADKAWHLLGRVDIRLRVEALRAQVAKRHEVTVESILAELEQTRAFAMSKGQTAAAVQASMGKAKLAGLIVDKAEVKGSIEQHIISLLKGLDEQADVPSKPEDPDMVH
jgi:hypothetical protein